MWNQSKCIGLNVEGNLPISVTTVWLIFLLGSPLLLHYHCEMLHHILYIVDLYHTELAAMATYRSLPPLYGLYSS